MLAAQDFGQVSSTPTYAETIEWIRGRTTSEELDAIGIRIRRTFVTENCRVELKRYGGALPLISGSFNLKDIAYLDVADRPVGTLWTGVFLIFRARNGEATIRRGDLVPATGQLAERASSSFEWHLGSSPAGRSPVELRELGSRLRNAFSHAIELCGGALLKEPF